MTDSYTRKKLRHKNDRELKQLLKSASAIREGRACVNIVYDFHTETRNIMKHGSDIKADDIWESWLQYLNEHDTDPYELSFF